MATKTRKTRKPKKPSTAVDHRLSGRRNLAKGSPAGTDLCGALKPGGDLCKLRAGAGTEHLGVGRCKRHGGNTPTQMKAAERFMAAQAVEMYGLPRRVDPMEALLEELYRTAGHVDFLRIQIGELSESDMHGPTGTEGVDDKTGLSHHPEAKPHVLIGMYQSERAHFVKVSETCLKVGIAERQVQLAEQQGKLIAGMLVGFCKRLGLDPQAPEVRDAARAELSVIAGQGQEVEVGS